MSLKLDRAMDKLRDEMAAASGNPVIGQVGEHLTQYLQAHPGVADKLGAEGKSIKGAMDALAAYAKKLPRSGNCVAVDDETGYRVILEYYGLEAEPARPAPAKMSLDLDALLGL